MAITVKHSKVSTIPDDADTSLVRPSDWNDDHVLTGTVPVANGGTGASTANGGFNALAPSQTGNSGKYLTTDGTDTSWATNPLGTVTSVSGTAPVSVATGTTTPVVSLAASYGDTQNPYASKTANYVLAAPNGSAGVPTFRALVAADIPALSSTYIPYTGASSAIDLNAQTVTNIAHLGLNSTAVPEILFRAYGDNNSTSRIAIRGYSSNASSSSIRVAKFRGTFASPQAPLSGDSLGKFELAGYGTTSSSGYPQASYEGVATENWGATARGAKALFYVTPNTTITQAVALTIDQDKSATFASTVTANGVLLTGNTGTVTSVAATAGTGISVSGSPITTSGTLTITNTAPDQTVAIASGTGISVTGTYPNFTVTNTSPSSGGTVTSVAATVPSFLSISGSPITTSGTLAISYSGTALPVANGGTGLTTLTTGYIPFGNGTSSFGSNSNLFWDNTNSRLGIGATSPSSKLTVGGNPPVAGAISAVGTNSGISLALSDNINSSLYVRNPAGGPIIGTDGGQALRFATSGNATTDEKMRIDSSGNVGIGTSLPTATLTVSGTGIANASWTTAGRPASPTNGQQGFNTTTNTWEAYNNGGWFSLNPNIVTNYQQFTSSGTFTPAAGVRNIQLIVVGGGAGGGNSGAGGGGAGGVVYISNFAVTPSVGITVTIGAGGSANANGVNSSFGSIAAYGGGRGGASTDVSYGNNSGAYAGGSGGGSGATSSAVGSGAPGSSQGSAGGLAPTTSPFPAGGGGGAGQVGQNGASGVNGNGGNGIYIPIFSSYGASGYFGGGGAGGYGGNTSGSGGLGGGGGTGVDGTANTGGGGGGNGATANAGGSGVIIVAWYQ